MLRDPLVDAQRGLSIGGLALELGANGVEVRSHVVPEVALAEVQRIGRFAGSQLAEHAADADHWAREAMAELQGVVNEQRQEHHQHDEHDQVARKEHLDLIIERVHRTFEILKGDEQDAQRQHERDPLGSDPLYQSALDIAIDKQSLAGYWIGHEKHSGSQ